MAEIEWKGAIWRAACGDFSIKELLTILKGFGPMEILEFEKPGHCRGQMSLCLSREGIKEITLYRMEVQGEKGKGQGRAALQWLKKAFNGELYVEDPGTVHVQNATEESLIFWVKMFREGLIVGLDGETCCLFQGMDETEVDVIEENIRTRLKVESGRPGRDESQGKN